MIVALLAAGLAVWAVGAAVDLFAGPATLAGRITPYVCGVAGGGLICALGVRAVLGTSRVVDLGTSLGTGAATLRVDALAGLFLTLVGALAAAISACLVSWARPPGRITSRGSASGYLLLLGSVVVIVVAGDAYTFLFGWESLTAAFYVVSAVARRDGTEIRSSWVTLGVGKVSGAALLVGFLLLAGRADSFTFATWSVVGPGPLRAAAWVLIVVGFGAKVGLLPFQVWLPVGYPAAQGPIRAAMAGLAANVGFYGLWRFLGVLGRPPVALVVVLLVVGGLTALVGIVFAAVQSRLPHVVAYSSIENAGIILVGYGMALAGAATGREDLIAVGLLAASLQVLAHGVAKSALFASSAFFESGEGTDVLDDLVGVGYHYRWSGVCFSLGSMTLAGLPPTIGFVSEWMILESLMQEYRVQDLALRLGMAAGGALVALTAGIASLCFIRLIGLTVLRRPALAEGRGGAERAGVFGRSGLGALGGACLGLAVIAPLVVRYLADGLAPVVATSAVAGARVSPWVLQPVFASFSKYSPSWMYVTMPIAFVAVAVFAVVASGGRLLRVRRVPAWRSGSGGVAGPDHYSSFGYANILRHVLGNVLGSRREVVVVASSDTERAHEPRVEVRAAVVEPIETYLYRPARLALLWMVRQVKRIQSGRLDAYVAYMLIALLVVLAVVAASR